MNSMEHNHSLGPFSGSARQQIPLISRKSRLNSHEFVTKSRDRHTSINILQFLYEYSGPSVSLLTCRHDGDGGSSKRI